MANMTTERPNGRPNAELLYLLHGDPAELDEALAGLRAADIADALRDLAPDAAAKVMAALPFDLAVQVFDEPELDAPSLRHRAADGRRTRSAPLIDAMSADQQADLFRELPETDRARLLKLLDAADARLARACCEYPPDTAGGIMTTEFVAVPATWTVERRARTTSARSARAKETVYAIYVLDPATQRLVHVVSLRDLHARRPARAVGDVGDRRRPLSVPTADRPRGGRAPHLQVQPARRARGRRRRPRPRHRHRRRRDRRDRAASRRRTSRSSAVWRRSTSRTWRSASAR